MQNRCCTKVMNTAPRQPVDWSVLKHSACSQHVVAALGSARSFEQRACAGKRTREPPPHKSNILSGPNVTRLVCDHVTYTGYSTGSCKLIIAARVSGLTSCIRCMKACSGPVSSYHCPFEKVFCVGTHITTVQ